MPPNASVQQGLSMSHRLRRLSTQTSLRNPDVRSSSRTSWTGSQVAVGLRFSTVNRKVTCYQLALAKEVLLSCFAQIFPLTCSYLTFRVTRRCETGFERTSGPLSTLLNLGCFRHSSSLKRMLEVGSMFPSRLRHSRPGSRRAFLTHENKRQELP